MKIIVEGLKAGPGLHQEQRPVHGAHGTHMQRFWVGGAGTPDEHTEHAKLHEKAATEVANVGIITTVEDVLVGIGQKIVAGTVTIN